ncbi:helix-turn-helix domain-containing protein [Mesoplasma tabanidae]|uniref:Insertion element IS150 protein InsJ-like helix-turn-helix domain-containing protein n=1 Tax=Mesoplasma tabanidae TaxID=219745 RepID=A0A2K8P3H2_9MOLU|nr:transposase [Mesoplasma tabanidae]ATZ21302.1 hypothetical protein MTABA_v1c00960 [Mesoplasma tabanidae]
MANIKGNKSIILSTQEKEIIVKEHFEKEMTFSQFSKKYNVSYSAIRKWCLDYEIYGLSALESQTGKMNVKQKGKAKPSSRSLDPKDREIAMLKKQLKQANMERDIWKKFDELMRESQKKK